MGKYAYAILTVFAIEFALFLFGGQNISKTSLFGLLFDPSTLTSNPLRLLIVGTFAGLGATAIIAGTFIRDSTTALYTAIALAFLGFSLSLAHFYTFLCGELDPLIGIVGTPACDGLAGTVVILITAPLLVFYILSTVEWMRSNY